MIGMLGGGVLLGLDPLVQDGAIIIILDSASLCNSPQLRPLCTCLLWCIIDKNVMLAHMMIRWGEADKDDIL